MPHCSLEFSHIGLPVAVHSQWNDAQTQCALHLFADHEHARAFLPDLPDAEARDFARCMMRCAFPRVYSGDGEGMHSIEGVVALSLTNFLVHLRAHVQKSIRIAEAPDLMGFWEPPAWRAPSEGIILWFYPDNEYHAVIAHAKEQAAEVIQEMSWLEHQRREILLAKINSWHIPRRSPHAAQEITGVCAEILCHASLAAKVRNAVHTQAKAAWN